MRILVATWHRHASGGTEQYLRALLPALAARGHTVALLHEHASHPGEQRAVDAAVPGIARWCAADTGPAAAVAAVRAWHPDVSFVHGLDSPVLEAALLGPHRSVLFAHGYYGTCGTGTKRHAFPTRRPCGRAFGAACLLLHYPRRCGGLDPVLMLRTFQLQQRRRRLLRRYDAVVVASSHMAEEFAHHGVSSTRLHCVRLPPPGAEPTALPPAARAPRGRLLFAGRLTREKGCDLLLEAMPPAQRALGRPLSLTVLGDGPERGALEARARRLQLDARFEGWVADEVRNAWMQESDLLVVPSVWPEPFGLVGIEAGCFGLPAAGFALGGIPDWLTAGHTGELAPGDPPAVAGLVEAIMRAVRDPGHLQALREGAWRVARDATMPRHLAALEPVLTGIP